MKLRYKKKSSSKIKKKHKSHFWELAELFKKAFGENNNIKPIGIYE